MDPWFLLGLLTLALGIHSLGTAISFSREVSRKLALSDNAQSCFPPATVILPCKGVEEGLEKNIRAILDQDYPDYEVLIVTADASDPAYPSLASILKTSPEHKARLLTAGHFEGMSEKIGNLLIGVKAARDESEILVFLDSDIRPGRGFLRSLVAPLRDPSVGASTGYRLLEGGEGIWSLLARLWNASILPIMANPRFNFAWGGAMALRRGDFLRLGVAGRWAGTISDDLVLSAAIREAGLRIEFVPQALTRSFGGYRSLRDLLQWTNRQLTILRWYAKKLWCLIGATHLFYDLMTAAAVALLLRAAFQGAPPPLAVPLLLSHIPLGCIKAWLIAAAGERALGNSGSKGLPIYAPLQPLASWLVTVNLLFSFRAKRITWRGVSYELQSLGKIRVISWRG